MSGLENIQQRAQNISARYTANFAGHPRITRRLDLLQTLIQELEDLQKESSSHDDATDELRLAIGRDLDNYRRELKLIEKAQQGDATSFASSRLVGWANLTLGRYRRGFAGKSRDSRDLSRLNSIQEHLGATLAQIDRLREVREGDQQLDHVHSLLTERMQTYEREQDAIQKVQGAGEIAERGSRYANMANHCLTLYRYHYAGRARVGRSKPLLQSILRELKRAEAGMDKMIQDGVQDERHQKNLDLVRQNVEAYTKEITHIVSAHEAATVGQRVSALGQAANDRFEEYKLEFAGKPRKSCDEQLLDQILEDLYHTAEQMDQIDRDHGDETNARNLQIVLDRMRMYDREHLAVVQSKQDSS